jgi:exopolysaccharide biosynthesis polyprenyl glycosylphosphotransferase
MERAFAPGSRPTREDRADQLHRGVLPGAEAEPTGREAAARRRRLVDPQRLFTDRGWVLLRLGLDVALLGLALAAARVGAPAAQLDADGEWLIWLFPPVVLALFAWRGLYGSRVQVKAIDGVWQVVSATSLAGISLIAVAAFAEPAADASLLVARAWLFATLYLAGGRALLVWTQRQARINGAVGTPTLIVGAGEIGAQVERRLEEQPELGLRLVGYLDADPPPAEMVPFRRAPVLGTPDELGQIAEATGARHVVLGFTSTPDRVLIPLVRECEARKLEVSLVPRLFESVNVRVALEHLGGLPLFGLRAVDPTGWQFAVKHLLDRLAAGFLLLVLALPLLAIAAAVKLSSPGPVFFRQRRIGRDGRDFEMLKFRSMRVESRERALQQAIALAEDTAPGGVEGADRRTVVGGFIRRSSLDELPQLLNVLRGEMSLVGPRPERPEFVELFGQNVRRYDDRHRVKSGITGWAQVHGLRGQTSLADRVEWDNYYIENWSLSLDLKILLMTLAAVFHRAE